MKKNLLKVISRTRSWSASRKNMMTPVVVFAILALGLLFQNCSGTKFNQVARDIASTSTVVDSGTLETPQQNTPPSSSDTVATTPPATSTSVCTMGSSTTEGCPHITNGLSQKYCANNGAQWGVCVSACFGGYSLSGSQPNIVCSATPVTTPVTTVPPVSPATKLIDNVPDYFAFKDVVNAEPYVWVTSETITVTGLEPNYEFVVKSSANGNPNYFLVDAGTTSLSGVFSNPKVVKTSANGSFRLALKTLSAGWGEANSTQNSVSKVTSALFIKPNQAISNVVNYADDSSFAFCNQQHSNCFSVNWNISTRIMKYQAVIVDQFGTVTSATPNAYYTSNTVTVSGLEPNHIFNICTNSSTGDAQIDAGTDSLSGQFAYQCKDVTTSSSGTIKVAIKARAFQQPGASNAAKLILRFNDFIEIPGSVFTVKTAGP